MTKGDKGASTDALFFVTLPDMENVHHKEPTEATANDTLTWRRALSIFPPAEGWVLSYALRGPSSADITATVDGADYEATLPAPATPGEYFLQGYVTLGARRTTIYNGNLTITPDLSAVTSDTYDGRSPNKKILDAIDAVIAGRATRSDSEYEIDFGGTRRRLKSVSLDELAKMRGIYAGKVWRENNSGKIGPGVQVCFGDRY